jgi:hypothetical protein
MSAVVGGEIVLFECWSILMFLEQESLTLDGRSQSFTPY